MARKMITMVKTINKIGKEIVALKIVPLPSSQRRGGRDINKNIAKPPLKERTGWSLTPKRCGVSDHPVYAGFLRLRDIFLEAAG